MSKELRFSSDDAQIEIYKNKGAIVAFTVWEGSKMEPAGFYKKQANDFMDSSLQNVSDIPDHDSVEQITHARLQLFHVNGKVTEMEITRKNEKTPYVEHFGSAQQPTNTHPNLGQTPRNIQPGMLQKELDEYHAKIENQRARRQGSGVHAEVILPSPEEDQSHSSGMEP